MARIRKFLPLPLLALLLLSDFVALREVRHALAWIVGDNATPAAISMLFLANAVTMAFFFDGLTPRAIRLLHLIAGGLYTVVMLGIYASGVEHGMAWFPAQVAQQAFGLSQMSAVRICAFAIGVALALASFGFWSVIGTLINHSAREEHEVAWQEKAARHGLPVDNILDLNHRATGS